LRDCKLLSFNSECKSNLHFINMQAVLKIILKYFYYYSFAIQFNGNSPLQVPPL